MSGLSPKTQGDGRDRRELPKVLHIGLKAIGSVSGRTMTVGPEARFVTVCMKPVGGVGEMRTTCLMKFFLQSIVVEFKKSWVTMPP
jgi:hypothetical protein